MSVLITAFILIVFNILMWAIFLVKFRKLFSTDSIVLATREKINGMIRDLNSNASRNIELLQEEIRQVKSVTAEAERRLALLKKDLEISEKAAVFQQKLSPKNPVQEADVRSESSEDYSERQAPVAVPDEPVTEQGPLPEQDENLQEVHSGKATISSLYGVPLQKKTEEATGQDDDFSISFSDNPIVPQEDFNSKVKELHVLGYSVFDIAEQTGHSVYEVNLAVKMI